MAGVIRASLQALYAFRPQTRNFTRVFIHILGNIIRRCTFPLLSALKIIIIGA
ncbi:MAG: hypothetical protein [Podoviridae sp. cty5g4]|nr:MAG: hypothetical protein [Podoviridae sp. cty5g4]